MKSLIRTLVDIALQVLIFWSSYQQGRQQRETGRTYHPSPVADPSRGPAANSPIRSRIFHLWCPFPGIMDTVDGFMYKMRVKSAVKLQVPPRNRAYKTLQTVAMKSFLALFVAFSLCLQARSYPVAAPAIEVCTSPTEISYTHRSFC